MCDVEYGVVWNVAIMQDVDSQLRCDVKCQWWCGIVVICNVLCDCSVISDVENDAMCCDVRSGGYVDVKSRCGVMRLSGIWCGVMQCGIWCDVKYGVMLNVGVVWNNCGYGMV